MSTVGGGPTDADGIHFRYTVPELSTTWTDSQSPPNTCADGSTYDDGELLVSQLILKAQPTTSGATGSFADMNGDSGICTCTSGIPPCSPAGSGHCIQGGGSCTTNADCRCSRVGQGFIAASNAGTDGPITVPGAEAGGPARPQKYDGTEGSVAAAVSEVFSGPNSPIKDIGFVAVTPNMPAVVVPPVCCNCTVQPDCPE